MPPPVTQAAPYEVAGHSVHAHLTGLGDRIDRLAKRLERFMKPAPPTAPSVGNCAVAASAQSEAVRGLQEIGGRVQMSTWALDDILDRLDV